MAVWLGYLGCFLGGLVTGVILMCLLQINRVRQEENKREH